MSLKHRIARLEGKAGHANSVLVVLPGRSTAQAVREHCARTGMSEADLLVIEVAFVAAR